MSSSLPAILLASALAVLVLLAVTAVIARRQDKYALIDVTWGLLFVAVSWVGVVMSGATARSLVLAALVTVWGGRLALHLARRTRGMGEDPRYVKILSGAPGLPRPGRHRVVRFPATSGGGLDFDHP